MAASSSTAPIAPGKPPPKAPTQSPAAPEEMLVQAPKEKERDKISLLELEFNQRFLLSILAECTGQHVKREAKGSSVAADVESCRDFLDKLAYLCDIRKGGPTVTATALQNLSVG